MPDRPTSLGVLAGPALGAASFRYHRPSRPEEVDDLLTEHGEQARLLAGGTDLLVQIRNATRRPAHVVDINALAATQELTVDAGQLRVGAGVQLWQLESHPMVHDRFAALRDGLRCVGSLQIQNRATLVGNVCNASPAADTAPALLLYDTTVHIRSARGARDVALPEFWLGPGRTCLTPDEWVEHLVMTDPGPHGSAYVKLGRSRGVDLALVGIACLDGDVGRRFAAASLSPTPRRLASVESLLRSSIRPEDVTDDRLDAALKVDVSAISDVRASARYRQAMARVCSRRAVAMAIGRREATAS